MPKSKLVHFRLSGADRVAFVLIPNREIYFPSDDDDRKYVRSFMRRGFLKRAKSMNEFGLRGWLLTSLGRYVKRKTTADFS
jgi:hypothetical protein